MSRRATKFNRYCRCGSAWETSFKETTSPGLAEIFDTLERIWNNMHDGDRCAPIRDRSEFERLRLSYELGN